MKKLLLIPVLLLVSIFSYSQFIYKIKADSVLITNDSCNAELNLENSTKDTLGFLYNTGKGRTQFRKGLIKINDSVYVIGNDTLYVARGMSPVPISKLVAATGTNTINNTNYLQEWQWNSLGGGSGLKLSSTSTSAASNLQRMLDVALVGQNTTGGQTTVAGYFSNKHKGTNSTNIALEAIADSGTVNNFSARLTGNVHMNGSNTGISFYLGSFGAADISIKRNNNTLLFNSPGYQMLSSDLDIYRFNPTDGHVWYTGNPATSKVYLKANGSLNIGTSIDSGALLTVHSTTKGFLRPRMNTTQRDAISSPAIGLSLYNTTLGTNDTYNGSEYFSFGNHIKVPATNTAGGTTGNQTINKVSGTVNIAAAGTTVTVTNSIVNANSIVYAVLRTNDATAYIKNVVPGAGTFTINLGAAATAEVSVGFVVFN